MASIILSFRVSLNITLPESSWCLPPYAMASLLLGALCVSFYIHIFLHCTQHFPHILGLFMPVSFQIPESRDLVCFVHPVASVPLPCPAKYMFQSHFANERQGVDTYGLRLRMKLIFRAPKKLSSAIEGLYR